MRSTRNEVIAFVVLVAFGVVLRLYLRDLPNFAPVAGLALFAGYLAILWSSYFMFGFALSYKLIFVPHLLNSFAALFAFSIIIYKHYQAFPDTITQLPLSLNTRIMHTQGFNYLLRLSRNVFTSNLLTPLFAYKFGLAQAGLFYLASTIATKVVILPMMTNL